ncbi:DUF4390 domain-containing protein [Desulfoluna sp.]|uniref:DUF4390 domain-containing protein n=1 Tax=Desulfoluna sp. TaxID=2045199 RepID=UPI00261BF11D|nr:DUF4390 domain-containing protein [Desulfoluna sp.]
MISRRKHATFIVALLLLLLPPFAGAAPSEPRLASLTITNTRDHLLLYTELEGAFVEQVEKAVHSGVETTISYYIDIFQQKRFWFDHRVASIRTEHRIKFDAMKKAYTITRSWAKPESVTTDSYEEAKQMMSRLEGVRAIALTDLTRGEAYQVRARARLEEFTLPVYLKFIGLFTDLDAFETNWRHAAFVY